MEKVETLGDMEMLWDLFERTGSVGVYLLFHEAKKNATIFEAAKRDVDVMKQDLEAE